MPFAGQLEIGSVRLFLQPTFAVALHAWLSWLPLDFLPVAYKQAAARRLVVAAVLLALAQTADQTASVSDLVLELA